MKIRMTKEEKEELARIITLYIHGKETTLTLNGYDKIVCDERCIDENEIFTMVSYQENGSVRVRDYAGKSHHVPVSSVDYLGEFIYGGSVEN